MLTKKEIVELSKERGFYLKRSLGQNFFIDKNLRDKLMELASMGKDDTVLEIGPGLGAFTEALADNCRRVYAVEKDRKLCALAGELLAGKKNLEMIHRDFLEYDLGLIPETGIKVFGALPFYITTPIIQRLFEARRRIDSIYIIVQKEVAARFTARPGGDDYSSLSLFVRFFACPEVIRAIKKDAFFPIPKVDAVFVKLDVLKERPVKVNDEETLFKVIRQAFMQRRKKLSSSLSHKEALGLNKGQMTELLESLSIDPARRAETLSLEEYAGIADGVIDFLL
jgi:16S rRNA (adenine1518-N6/adenine1519-N6)-dimethyltransferase